MELQLSKFKNDKGLPLGAYLKYLFPFTNPKRLHEPSNQTSLLYFIFSKKHQQDYGIDFHGAVAAEYFGVKGTLKLYFSSEAKEYITIFYSRCDEKEDNFIIPVNTNYTVKALQKLITEMHNG